MDDYIGRRGLLEPAHLKSMTRRSDARGLVQLASHVGAIATTGVALAYTWGSLWAVPVFVLHGMLLNYLYAGQHECSHWTAFKSRHLNNAVGRVFGFLVFYARDDDRWYHFHHRHTQDLEKDPEIDRRRIVTLASFVISLSGVTYWKAMFVNLVNRARGNLQVNYLTPEQRPVVIAEARWTLAGYGAIALVSIVLGSWDAVICWAGPLLLTKWTHQTQNLIEHTGLTNAPDTLANTRTITTIAPLRWLTWNMVYHSAHHTFPRGAVPCPAGASSGNR